MWLSLMTDMKKDMNKVQMILEEFKFYLKCLVYALQLLV